MKNFVILLVVLFSMRSPWKCFAAQAPIPADVFAPSAIVIDADTGIIVFAKNPGEQHFPASITKVMTALLALELSNGNFEQQIGRAHV